MPSIITTELETSQLETYLQMFGIEREDIISILSNTHGQINGGYGHIGTTFVLVYMGEAEHPRQWQESLEQEKALAAEVRNLEVAQSVRGIRSEGGGGMLGLPPGQSE